MMQESLKLLIICTVLWCFSVDVTAQFESPAKVVKAGQWLEIRGQTQSAGKFIVHSVALVEPKRYESLVGTIQDYDPGEGRLTLLGQSVEIQPKTTISRLDRNALEGKRVKVEGYFRNKQNFSARVIRPRNEGRDRIVGRVDRIRSTRQGIEFSVMNYTILVPDELPVSHETQAHDYQTTESRVQTIIDRGRDEDDLFGKGIRITDNIVVSGQARTRIDFEDEYDLLEIFPGDRRDSIASLRGRLVYHPSHKFFALFQANYQKLWRDDDRIGRMEKSDTRISEFYLYWLSPFDNGLDIQIGRIDFDEKREWLYDQDLDGPRLIWNGEAVRVELSVSTTLTDGSPEDEDTINSILYISNVDEDRHVGGYVIHRDFDFPRPERRTHVGFRAFGEWLPGQDSWLEISHMQGKSIQTDSRGWGFDIGTSWKFHDHFALTGGFALGTGDDLESARDGAFRQTGLNDNNDKFAGVTSFRYYGELTDPELANLEILTIGIGWLPRRGVSLDLVGHSYRQNELNRKLIDMSIDRRPNGRSADLGWEIDLVLGWRTSRKWDLEVIAAMFRPGKAFDVADDAYMGKFQFRYRF